MEASGMNEFTPSFPKDESTKLITGPQAMRLAGTESMSTPPSLEDSRHREFMPEFLLTVDATVRRREAERRSKTD